MSASFTAERRLLRSLFDAAIAAVDPARLFVGRRLPVARGRTVVVGAGKAAAAMASAFERQWPGPPHDLRGLVVTRYGHGVATQRIRVVEAAHPVPDAAGRQAAARILEMAAGLEAKDLLVCLISGGGSALLSAPAPGMTLDDKQAVNRALLVSGARIDEMNCVRKHLSAVKGGRLAAAAHPARVVTYLISDVPGDDPSVVASGPTVPDPTTYEDALQVLTDYSVEPPPAIMDYLLAGSNGRIPDTPKPGDAAFVHDEVVVLATAREALLSASTAARRAGAEPLVLGDAVEGEARSVAAAHAGLALALAAGDQTVARRLVATLCAFGSAPGDLDPRTRPVPSPPTVVLSGGETTVTVRGGGRGGRDAEYALALALGLKGHPGIAAIACDTDGIDGSEDNAGAIVTPDTLERARSAGLEPEASLEDNDAYSFFRALGDLVLTGPTRTNVNDFRAVLVRATDTDRPPRT